MGVAAVVVGLGRRGALLELSEAALFENRVGRSGDRVAANWRAGGELLGYLLVVIAVLDVSVMRDQSVAHRFISHLEAWGIKTYLSMGQSLSGDKRVNIGLVDGISPLDTALGAIPFLVSHVDDFLWNGRMMAIAVPRDITAITKYYHVEGWTVRA